MPLASLTAVALVVGLLADDAPQPSPDDVSTLQSPVSVDLTDPPAFNSSYVEWQLRDDEEGPLRCRYSMLSDQEVAAGIDAASDHHAIQCAYQKRLRAAIAIALRAIDADPATAPPPAGEDALTMGPPDQARDRIRPQFQAFAATLASRLDATLPEWLTYYFEHTTVSEGCCDEPSTLRQVGIVRRADPRNWSIGGPSGDTGASLEERLAVAKGIDHPEHVALSGEFPVYRPTSIELADDGQTLRLTLRGGRRFVYSRPRGESGTSLSWHVVCFQYEQADVVMCVPGIGCHARVLFAVSRQTGELLWESSVWVGGNCVGGGSGAWSGPTVHFARSGEDKFVVFTNAPFTWSAERFSLATGQADVRFSSDIDLPLQP